MVYLTVNKERNYSVEGTINVAKASSFHVVPCDGSHPNEFMLIYHNKESTGHFQMLHRGNSCLNEEFQQAVCPMPWYLNARTSMMGKNKGPLQLSDHVEEGNVRLVLQSRVQSKSSRTVMDPTPWVTGREVYFIRCARRQFHRDGYLCVKFQPGREGRPTYKLCIVSSTDDHNTDKFMLFRLLPMSLKNQLEPVASKGDTEIVEEEGKDEFERLNVHYRRFSEHQTQLRSTRIEGKE